MYDPINFLTVELLTLLYPLLLIHENFYPLSMCIIIIVHLSRFIKNYKLISFDLKINLMICFLYSLVIYFTFKLKNFYLSGILFGMLQIVTYIYHEKISNVKYKWFRRIIDIPITIFSSYITYYGITNNNLMLTPFMGDLIYHIFEIVYLR